MRERGREAADEGKQPTCSRREACVGFNNSAGFTFQPVGGTSGSPLGEDGQNVASNSRPCVTASGGEGVGVRRRALTSLQQLQVRGESCIGICQRSKAEVPEMENGGEQREHGVDLLAGKEEEEEERRRGELQNTNP